MQLTRLKLVAFRNYQALEFEPHPRLTILVGNNAQGKTNVIEAIFLCAAARSHRTSKDNELIRWDQKAAYIGLELKAQNCKRKIEIKLSHENKKQIKLDGIPLKKVGELIGNLYAVLFSPEDLKLVKDGPMERRRFIDLGASQLDRAYFYRLVNYNRTLVQRNALLREIAAGRSRGSELVDWNGQLASIAGEIAAARRNFIENIETLAGGIHDQIAKERLLVKYKPDVPGDSPSIIAENMMKVLEEKASEDIKRGSTSAGPHKDDISLRLDGIDVRSFGSQGQQRTVALSLKLAELELIRNQTQQSPVLLLDDVFSELDDSRQQLLLRYIKDSQTVLTCTSLSGLSELGGMDIYHVESGTLQRLK